MDALVAAWEASCLPELGRFSLGPALVGTGAAELPLPVLAAGSEPSALSLPALAAPRPGPLAVLGPGLGLPLPDGSSSGFLGRFLPACACCQFSFEMSDEASWDQGEK